MVVTQMHTLSCMDGDASKQESSMEFRDLLDEGGRYRYLGGRSVEASRSFYASPLKGARTSTVAHFEHSVMWHFCRLIAFSRRDIDSSLE